MAFMALDADVSYGKGVFDVNITINSITLLYLSLAAMAHAISFLIMYVVRIQPIRHRPGCIPRVHE